jgi:Ni,Fe-hydrogenase III component G
MAGGPWKLAAMILVAIPVVALGFCCQGRFTNSRADRANHRGYSMNVLPSVQPILDEVTQRFGPRLEKVLAPHSDEIYFHARMELVPGFCGHLYKKWNARLVSLFADDARAQEKAFHLYYVFALDAAHAFFVLRVPVAPDRPEFTSLTNAVHAVNWQEREVQDLFGLKLVGHPNPRRCALHDDWPEVYPLRKDFDLRTKLPPFQGERHQFRAVEGEGVFQVPVGPVHAGIIEPGHFRFSVAGEPVPSATRCSTRTREPRNFSKACR